MMKVLYFMFSTVLLRVDVFVFVGEIFITKNSEACKAECAAQSARLDVCD